MTQAVAVKVLAVLIALQVGVGGVALATVETPEAVRTGAGTTTTTAPSGTAVLPEGAQDAGEPEAGSGAQPQDQPGTPAAPDGASSAPPADLNSLPERPSPPRHGAYRYRTKFNGQFSAGTLTTQVRDEQESTTRYEPAPSVNGETRDRERTEAEGSSGGMSFSGQADKERGWRQNGMFVTRESGSGSGGGGSFEADCDWEPDVQELAFPLRNGAAWEWSSTCESRSENMDSKQTWRGAARVTGSQTATVAGKEVRVLVIERRSERTVDFTFRREGGESKGTSTYQETTRQLYAPSVALTVRADTDVKGTFDSPGQPGGGGRFEGRSEMELLSLDPR